MIRIYKKIRRLFANTKIPNLFIGDNVELINNGKIISSDAYLGFVENRAVKIANKSGRSYLKNSGEIQFGKNVRIHKGFGIEIDGHFSVGDNTFINPDCIIYCKNRISIGSNCAISWNVTILDDDLHTVSKTAKKTDVTICDNVWIGAGSFIGKGVTIGSGSIIAAGSIVVNDVPEKTLFGGNPAKLLKSDVSWC